jgi:hypothetical protein
MRNVRNAQSFSHGFVITIAAILLLSASAMLGAPHPRVTVQKAAEPVRNEYLIMLNVPANDVPKVATELTKRYGGEVLAVWQHAVKGFWLKAEPEVVRHMVQDRRIRSCEENAVAHDSGTAQYTGPGAAPTPNGASTLTGAYPPLGSPDHPLWHLNRISHRQRQDGLQTPDFKYRYGSDGSGVAIYIIDSGVLRWHQEFYSDSATQTTITNQAASGIKDGSPRVLSNDAANIADGRKQPLYVVEWQRGATGPLHNSLVPGPINSGDPIAPVGDCVAPAPYKFGGSNDNVTHGTACASVAAGRNVGVAKGANIVPVRVFNCERLDSLGAVISGLDWTLTDVQHQQTVKSTSWDYPAVVSMSVFFTARPDGKTINIVKTVQGALTEFDGTGTLRAVGRPLDILNESITALTNYGVPVAVSANNQSNNACFTAPANLSIRAGGHVISVGGLSKGSDSRWITPAHDPPTPEENSNPGSNYGQCVDIWAPAEAIELATIGPDDPSSNGIAYRSSLVSGTSFSAPIVAGIIARLMSENTGLVGRDASAVRRIYDLLTSSATRIPDNDWLNGSFGADSPRLIAYIGAVQITRQPESFEFNGTEGESRTLTVSMASGLPYTYQWYKGEKPGNPSDPLNELLPGKTDAALPLIYPADKNNSYWVRVTGPGFCGSEKCFADSIAAKASAPSGGGTCPAGETCPLNVKADAAFLTRVIEIAPVESEPGMLVQQIEPDGVEIVARAFGPGPYTCEVTGFGPAITVDAMKEDPPNADPSGQAQWVAKVKVAPPPPDPNNPTADPPPVIYTVKFLKGTVYVGSTTVSVSVCQQPRIKRLAPKYVWQVDGSTQFPLAHMLDETYTTLTDSTFQWFVGPYSQPSPLDPNPGGVAVETTRLAAPRFVPLADGQYWARVDGRCGWAVSAHIDLVSCYKYNADYLRITAPPGHVAAGRPVFLASKLVTPNGVFNADAYEWTIDPGPGHTNQVISSQPIVMVTPPAGAPTKYQLKVTNAGGECGNDTLKSVTLTTSSCRILASGDITQSVDSDGTVLGVELAQNVNNPGYAWFNTDPTTWTWTNGVLVPLGHDATFRPPKGATQRYFVRVTAPCGTDSTSEDSYVIDLGVTRARTNGYKPMHVKGVASTYYEFAAGEGSVVLSVPELLPNATYNWYSSESYNVPGDPVGTGTELTINRTDVEPKPHNARTYWVSTTNSAGDVENSAMVRLVAVPAVTVTAFPGTVIGTESSVALTAKPAGTPDGTMYPVGTRHEWRQATPNFDAEHKEDGTFTKDMNSPILNSNLADGTIWRGPIDGHAAFWVHVVQPNGATADSDLVLIVVHCDQPPNLAVFVSPNDHHVQRDTPVIFSAQGVGRNLTYQWYNGVLGDLLHSNPVGSGGGALWTTSPDGTYWVHATDDCGRTAEAATTVYLCKPTIPNNVSPADVWIKSGDWAHLSVNATKAKPSDVLHYKWYPGNLNLPALPDRTDSTLDVNYTGTFLATVSSDCGDGANDDVVSAPMTVRVCTSPPINGLSPASHDTRLGTVETLYVAATGDALTYQWYQGAAGILTNPVAEGTTAAISVQPSVDSDYWVRVTDHGACSSDSAVIHLTVCAPPAIDTQPAGSTVNSGQAVTLTVVASKRTAAPLHYTWFEVAANGSEEAVSIDGPPSFTTPALTTSRTWFVRVCSGDQRMTYTDSQPATVTVTVCNMPAVQWATPPRPLLAGELFTLQIYAPPPGSRMTWYQGVSGDVSMPISATDVTYTQVIPPAPSTSYWVRVQKDTCYADSPTLTLNVCVPTITTQPVGGPPITLGGSVNLSVVANTSPLTYQWYKGASGDTSQPATGAGATTATYTASPAADTSYWVRVTGSCGVATDSNAVLVSVCYPPAIVSTSPVSQWAVLGGGSTTVSVNATGSNLSYQWYTGISGNTASPLSATTSSLTVTPQNTTSYWVRVSGSCGTPQNSVTMTVNVCGTPAITVQPQGSTINSGGTATMSVTATEATTTPMTYQWYRGVSGDVSNLVPNAIATSFTTPTLSANTSYWVRVSRAVCTPADSQTATVSVCNNAQPLAAPADQFIAIGQTATLSTAPGSGNVYQWYIGASGNTSQPAPGTANQSSYAASPSVTTQYWVQIQNGVCTFRTLSATVNVCVPAITQQPASIMINPGASTTLSVAANTSGLTYQWYIGNSGTTTSPISGATASSVTVSPSTATYYWVRITGSCSQSVNSATASVTICAPPAINGNSSTQSVIRNNSTSCFVTAVGTNLTYQWYVGTSGTTTTPISGATAASVSVTPQNTTSYWVRVTGTCGTINSATMLVNVCASPAITAQPQGAIIFSGGTATMSVTATEGTTTPMTYQWYRGASGDVSAPVGTNSTSFTTPALTAQTSYWVRVSCGICNPADSQAATISICYYPQNLGSPGDFYNTVGQTVRLYTSNVSGNTYQWYTGASGDTSHPYTSPGSPNYSYADVSPTVTTQYWVQIQNGGCISRTAASNVYVCVPTFTQQPAGVTIIPGSSTTLSASANTAGVTYQWYVGASGNTASPISGATGPSVTVTPGANTTYWVRAIGTCGRTTDSAAATVVLCSPPAITAQPMGSFVQGGGAIGSMWVSATGSNLTYQWYSGNSGDMSLPIDGATGSSFSMWLQNTQKVWVRITGTCGAVNSNSTFVSVYPSIYQQPPSSLVVGYDTTASISLAASGSYLSYVWKNSMTGAVIATTTTPTLITPSITADTYIQCQVVSGNATTNAYETHLTVCYNQPNVTLINAPNGACRMLYTTTNTADDYQWYQGARGDTSHLLGSGGTALTVCPTAPTQYWVRAIVWSSYQVVSCYTDSNAVTAP